MRMFVYDVFSLTSDLCLQYTPILGWCANRSEVWRSLKKGEMDLSFPAGKCRVLRAGAYL